MSGAPVVVLHSDTTSTDLGVVDVVNLQRSILRALERASPAGADRPVVFVASPDEQGGARFERRDVEVGARANDLVHIVRGLIAGDIVVTGGAFAVKSEFARSRMSAG